MTLGLPLDCYTYMCCCLNCRLSLAVWMPLSVTNYILWRSYTYSYYRGEPAVSYKWTGRVWEITGRMHFRHRCDWWGSSSTARHLIYTWDPKLTSIVTVCNPALTQFLTKDTIPSCPVKLSIADCQFTQNISSVTPSLIKWQRHGTCLPTFKVGINPLHLYKACRDVTFSRSSSFQVPRTWHDMTKVAAVLWQMPSGYTHALLSPVLNIWKDKSRALNGLTYFAECNLHTRVKLEYQFEYWFAFLSCHNVTHLKHAILIPPFCKASHWLTQCGCYAVQFSCSPTSTD